MFDLRKPLEAFEKELNGYPRKGMRFHIDKDSISQDIGGGSWVHFNVESYYEPDNIGTTIDMIASFCSGLETFVNRGQRGLNGGRYSAMIDSDRKLSITAKVDIPMTSDDFGDQL